MVAFVAIAAHQSIVGCSLGCIDRAVHNLPPIGETVAETHAARQGLAVFVDKHHVLKILGQGL